MRFRLKLQGDEPKPYIRDDVQKYSAALIRSPAFRSPGWPV